MEFNKLEKLLKPFSDVQLDEIIDEVGSVGDDPKSENR